MLDPLLHYFLLVYGGLIVYFKKISPNLLQILIHHLEIVDHLLAHISH